MGKPAARMGDTTAHGGAITLGNPTVLIGKMPASALGDMHICPMCTPAAPPIPHVGGPILLGSTGVFIGKKPAARIADTALCVGPPSMPAMGCMTVLIGEVGGGSQAGSAGSAAAALAAKKKGPKAIKPFPLAEPPVARESHYVECEFVDSAGKPLAGVPYLLKDPVGDEFRGVSTSDGRVYHGGYAEAGPFSVVVPALTRIEWSKSKVGTKEPIGYSAQVEGFEEGAYAYVTIAEEDGPLYRVLEFRPCEVKGGRIEGEWRWSNSYLRSDVEPDSDGSGAPVYTFQVVVGFLVGISGPLIIADSLNVKVTDPEGKVIPDLPYELSLPNGEIVTGHLDAAGSVKRSDVPPGKHKIRLINPEKSKAVKR